MFHLPWKVTFFCMKCPLCLVNQIPVSLKTFFHLRISQKIKWLYLQYDLPIHPNIQTTETSSNHRSHTLTYCHILFIILYISFVSTRLLLFFLFRCFQNLFLQFHFHDFLFFERQIVQILFSARNYCLILLLRAGI